MISQIFVRTVSVRAIEDHDFFSAFRVKFHEIIFFQSSAQDGVQVQTADSCSPLSHDTAGLVFIPFSFCSQPMQGDTGLLTLARSFLAKLLVFIMYPLSAQPQRCHCRMLALCSLFLVMLQVFVFSPLSSQLVQSGSRLLIGARLYGVMPEEHKHYRLQVCGVVCVRVLFDKFLLVLWHARRS